MKKYIFICLLLYGAMGYSQSWVNVIKTMPYYSYSFPGNPSVVDTLNIRSAYYVSDSMVVFQVLEFKETPFDSVNTDFQTALQQTGGDTLLSIAKTISLANNTTILNSEQISSFTSYKGLEVSMQYNTAYMGKVLLTYTRFFYNEHTLLSFTVTGTQDEYSLLLNNKTLFFDSIKL